MTSHIEYAKDLIIQVENLYPKLNGLRKTIMSKQQWINRNKILLNKSTFNKMFKIKYIIKPDILLPEFNMRQFWLRSLLEFYKNQIDHLTKVNDEFEKFYIAIISLSKIYNDDIPVMIRNENYKTLDRCPECYKIFGCKKHKHAEQHNKLWCKKLIENNTQNEVAIDTEFVYSENKEEQTNKHRLIPFRVAACMNIAIGKEIRPTLVYHSFWNPGDDFKVWTPVVGLTKFDFHKNQNQFVDANEGKQKLIDCIIKKRILIFAGSTQDLQALNLQLNNEIRDIQKFYCRNPNDKNKQPIKLSWLAKHIFFSNIQEMNENNPIHNPVIDALFTLKLYNKIPTKFWDKSMDGEIQIQISNNNGVLDNFQDDFEPDYEI